jgi:hypothetical protein
VPRRTFFTNAGFAAYRSVSPTMIGFGAMASVILLGLLQQEAAVAGRQLPDRDVLATVLEDLATYRGKHSPIDGIFSPNPLTLHPVPARYPRTVESVLDRYNPARWKALSAENTSALREAAENLVRRISANGEVFAAGSKHVPLYSGSDAEAESFRKSPIKAWWPGYSEDGHLAIVALAIPWSIHGCSATYVLTRGDKGWTVRVRDFACYM